MIWRIACVYLSIGLNVARVNSVRRPGLNSDGPGRSKVLREKVYRKLGLVVGFRKKRYAVVFGLLYRHAEDTIVSISHTSKYQMSPSLAYIAAQIEHTQTDRYLGIS